MENTLKKIIWIPVFLLFTVSLFADINSDLFQAVGSNNIIQTKKLIDKGANVNARNRSRQTPLMFAASRGFMEIARLLIEKGADVNATYAYANVLMAAASANRMEMAQLLIEKGAKVNGPIPSGATPIYSAIKRGLIDMVKFLIKKGADVNVKDRYGITPLKFAIQYKKYNIVKILKAAGAR